MVGIAWTLALLPSLFGLRPGYTTGVSMPLPHVQVVVAPAEGGGEDPAAGRIAFIDSETGQLRQPTEAELREWAALAAQQEWYTKQYTTATEEAVPGGGFRAVTDGPIWAFLQARREADGTLRVSHGAGAVPSIRRAPTEGDER